MAEGQHSSSRPSATAQVNRLMNLALEPRLRMVGRAVFPGILSVRNMGLRKNHSEMIFIVICE